MCCKVTQKFRQLIPNPPLILPIAFIAKVYWGSITVRKPAQQLGNKEQAAGHLLLAVLTSTACPGICLRFEIVYSTNLLR